MMGKKWKSLAVMALAFGLSFSANSTVVTFEDTAAYEQAPDGYGGISGWSNLAGWVYEGQGEGVGNQMFYGREGMISFDAAPVVFQGTYFKSYATDYSNGAPVAIELYFRGALVHSIFDHQVGGSLEWFASGYAGLVDQIFLRGGGEGFGLDNLMYEVSAVPLPAAWLLFSGGGAALLGLRRRGKKALQAGNAGATAALG